MEETKIAIACQGGGSQTAFTAGALKALCDSRLRDAFEVVGVSGASGGALCATLVWYSFRRGDQPIWQRLIDFWLDNTTQNQSERNDQRRDHRVDAHGQPRHAADVPDQPVLAAGAGHQPVLHRRATARIRRFSGPAAPPYRLRRACRPGPAARRPGAGHRRRQRALGPVAEVLLDERRRSGSSTSWPPPRCRTCSRPWSWTATRCGTGCSPTTRRSTTWCTRASSARATSRTRSGSSRSIRPPGPVRR